MVFVSLNDNEGLVAIFGCNDQLDASDVEQIENIAIAAYEENDEELDELFEIIIKKCKEELGLEIFLCAPDYDIYI